MVTSPLSDLPRIIQGGMGVGISGWRLANAVSSIGQLGVVAGTALDRVMIRRLQSGDPGGHIRRALDHFPFPEIAERMWDAYYVDGGLPDGAAYANPRMYDRTMARDIAEPCIVANFVEVWLAKEGHSHPVGINLLTKVQMPNLPTLYGAALRDERIHVAEHAAFFLTALVFWYPILERGRSRFRFGVVVLYLFAAGLQCTVLGAAITFARHPWYIGHYATTAAWGLTPLEDQQLAGLIMWIPASLAYLVALVPSVLPLLRSPRWTEPTIAGVSARGTP